jgi:hypothetical protein
MFEKVKEFFGKILCQRGHHKVVYIDQKQGPRGGFKCDRKGCAWERRPMFKVPPPKDEIQ